MVFLTLKGGNQIILINFMYDQSEITKNISIKKQFINQKKATFSSSFFLIRNKT